MDRAGCPNVDELRGLHVGRLPDDRASAVANHVAACSHCSLVVSRLQQQVDVDPLLRALQRCRGAASLRHEPDCKTPLALFKKTIRHSVLPDHVASFDTEVPSRVGPYRIIEPLGRGGMGTVYRAVHRERGTSVALKVVPSPADRESHVRARFRRECELIRQLRHSRIVRVEESGEADGVQFLAMELLDGLDVSRLVQRLGALSVPDACEIVRQAALALDAAHQQGLIHRDVKPSNLMLTGRGEVKLLDLGLARAEEHSQSLDEITQTGQVIGTIDYMAPEQAFDPRAADHRADLYSLGCLLYKLLTGRAPYAGRFRYRLQKLLAHAQVPPDPLPALRPEVPPPVVELTERLLAKSPGDRPPTAGRVARELEPFARGHGLVQLLSGPIGDTHVGTASDTKDSPAAEAPSIRIQPETEEPAAAGAVPRKAPSRRRGRFSLVAGLLLVLTLTGAWYVASGFHYEAPGTLGTWSYPPEADGLNGLIPEPADLPGIGRWQVETVAPRGYIYGLSWSRDGNQLAVGSSDHRIRIYDPKSGRLRHVLAGHTGQLPDLDFSPDGRRLASAGGWGDWSARVWSTESGAPGAVLSAEYAAVSVDWGPQGRRLAVLRHAPRRQVEVWDPLAAEIIQVFDHNDPKQLSMAWSPDGRRIASQGNRTLRIFDVSAGVQQAVFDNPQSMSGHDTKLLAWSPDSRRLAAAGEDNTVRLYDPAAGTPGPILRGHSGAIKAVAWSPDGRWIASGGLDETIRIWSADDDEQPPRVLRHAWWVASLAWGPEGHRLASGSRNGTVRIWNAEDGHLIREIGSKWPDVLRNAFSCVSFSPDGETMASASADGKVRLWDPETGRITTVIDAHDEAVGWVRFSPDGRRLASASFGPYGEVCLWNVTTGTEESLLEIQVAGVGAFSGDGRRLAIPGSESVRIVDTQTRETVRTFRGHAGHVLAAEWGPDDRWLATGGDDGTVRLWSMQQAMSGPVLKQHEGKVQWLSWDPNENRLISIGGKQGQASLVCVWNISDGTAQLDEKEQLEPTLTAAEVLRGTDPRLVTGSQNGVIEWRNLADGVPQLTVPAHSSVVRSLAPQPRNGYIASASDDATLCLWEPSSTKVHWLAVLLPNGRAAAFSGTGELLVQDPAVEEELVYLLEQPSGALELLTADEFQSRSSQAFAGRHVSR